MSILVILTVMNAVMKQYSFVNANRLQIGVLQIGALEILLALGLVVGLLRVGAVRSKFPTPISAAFIGLMSCLIIGLIFGLLGAMRNDVGLKETLSGAREYGSIPICIFCGYSLLATPRSGRRYALLAATAGVLTATLLMMGFGENAEKANLVNDLNPLRGVIIDFNSEYAAVSALLLIYCVVMGLKLMPRPIMILLSIYAFIGYISTLSRTSSLVMAFGILMSFFLLPPGKRVGKMFKAAVFGVVIGFSIFGSLQFADALVGRDFIKKLEKHFEAALPGAAEDADEPRAYTARFEAYHVELGIWLSNPVMGSGFGIQEALHSRGQVPDGPAYNHNGMTTTLCKTGIVGFVGCVGTLLSLMFLGWRINRQAVDKDDLIVGGLCFVTGCVFFTRACCTMSFTTRAAICFALTAGVMLRYREMQRAKIAALRDYEAQPPELLADQVEWGYAPDYSAGHYV